MSILKRIQKKYFTDFSRLNNYIKKDGIIVILMEQSRTAGS